MKSIFLFLILLLYFPLFAQDIHLSQFYNQDHLLNPAKVGDYDGDYRITANYRNQWRQLNKQPISTYLLSFDHIFFFDKHQFHAGLMLTSDRFQGEESNYATGIPFSYTVNSYCVSGLLFVTVISYSIVFLSTLIQNFFLC